MYFQTIAHLHISYICNYISLLIDESKTNKKIDKFGDGRTHSSNKKGLNW